ncbi:MAG: hypothetical protein ACE367_13805 [Acidimicrobiales bacterium]
MTDPAVARAARERTEQEREATGPDPSEDADPLALLVFSPAVVPSGVRRACPALGPSAP